VRRVGEALSSDAQMPEFAWPCPRVLLTPIPQTGALTRRGMNLIKRVARGLARPFKKRPRNVYSELSHLL
jgi:hypothetical protein